jgi:hypothetical protein
MPFQAQALAHLLRSQNRDGGWGHGPGEGSWTEATAFALLAIGHATRTKSAAAEHGLKWLTNLRRQDGGWSPHPKVRESTWVTALVLLVLHRFGSLARQDLGFDWLLRVEGVEGGWVNRLRRWMLGRSQGRATRLAMVPRRRHGWRRPHTILAAGNCTDFTHRFRLCIG